MAELGTLRPAGRGLALKTTHGDLGALAFRFATDAKSAGLLPHMLGEFRLQILWTRGRGATRRQDRVNFFQYTSADDNAAWAASSNGRRPTRTGAGGSCGPTWNARTSRPSLGNELRRR